MSPSNFFSNMRVPDDVKLIGKYNFEIWHMYFVNHTNYGKKNLYHYLTCDEGDENYVDDENDIFHESADAFIKASISPEILETLRHKGLKGKAAYKAICEIYGTFTPKDKILQVTKYTEECLDENISISERISTANRLNRFILKQPEEERECLMHFLWIGQSAKPIMDKFIEMNLPLAMSSFDIITSIYPHLSEPPATTPVATKTVSDRALNNSYNYLCFNCLGFGHKKAECPSPLRTISTHTAIAILKQNIRKVLSRRKTNTEGNYKQ